MDEQEDKALKVVTNFINLMTDLEDGLLFDLSDDAVMDWFGRSILGRKSIVRFLRMHFFKIQHTIEKIQVVPPVSHRLLNRFDSDIVPPLDKLPIECGQGDCQVTPENTVRPNLEELVKAPRKMRYQQCSVSVKQWQFVEFKGKLQFVRNGDSVEHFAEKKVQRIILGYTDQIHFIAYEAKIVCKKKLAICNVSSN